MLVGESGNRMDSESPQSNSPSSPMTIGTFVDTVLGHVPTRRAVAGGSSQGVDSSGRGQSDGAK